MNTRAKILSAVLLIAAPLAARPKVDVIVMANGDHITGEIKSLSAGVLRVDLDYVDGSVALQWMKVARVESPQLFIVHTQDGSVLHGNALHLACRGEQDPGCRATAEHGHHRTVPDREAGRDCPQIPAQMER